MTSDKKVFSQSVSVLSIALMILTSVSTSTNAFVMNPSLDYFPASLLVQIIQ